MNPPPRSKPIHPDPHEWIQDVDITTSADVKIPERLVDQVIGQDAAVHAALKAAEQQRNLLLVGDPGTGKSMLARAMAEVLPKSKQSDLLVYHNKKNANEPKAITVDGGMGRPLMAKYDAKAQRKVRAWRVFEYGVGFGTIGLGLFFWLVMDEGILSFLFGVLIALLFLYFAGQSRPRREFLVPNMLIESGAEEKPAPYVDGTGSHAGALLGDVRHDPFQSGGLETPAHVRVEAGAIHRAHKGVLFIDEINVLRLQSQQALLTAMQEKKYSISGQSQNSSGAMIRTEPIPCDFILVAAGNLDAVQPPDPVLGVGMHPALRSRIRGYGYEVYVDNLMEDDDTNRRKLVQFVAQEVQRDGRIPHFDRPAIAEVIREAQRRSGRAGKLTLRLRELGGLVRTAGDVARTHGADLVTVEHVREAKRISRSLEQQIAEKDIEHHLDAEARITATGSVVGTAHGVAIVGTGEVGEPAGIVVPVEAAVVPALDRNAGSIRVGKRLESQATSSIENVAAVLKRFKAGDLVDRDIHVDARLAHPDAVPDGIGLAAAVAAISALESVPVHQGTALIAEVTVGGGLRPVRGTLQRIEAALATGLDRAIVPASMKETLLVDEEIRAEIEVVYCESLSEAIAAALDVPVRSIKAIQGRLGASDAVKAKAGRAAKR